MLFKREGEACAWTDVDALDKALKSGKVVVTVVTIVVVLVLPGAGAEPFPVWYRAGVAVAVAVYVSVYVATSLVPFAWPTDAYVGEKDPKSPTEGAAATVPISTTNTPRSRPPRRPPPKRLLSIPVRACLVL